MRNDYCDADKYGYTTGDNETNATPLTECKHCVNCLRFGQDIGLKVRIVNESSDVRVVNGKVEHGPGERAEDADNRQEDSNAPIDQAIEGDGSF
jgi:hypothetical protein